MDILDSGSEIALGWVIITEGIFYKDESKFVFVCGDKLQSDILIDALINNHFRILLGEDENGVSGIVLKFLHNGVEKPLAPIEPKFIKYFQQSEVQYITTAFDAGDDQIVCQSESIKIGGTNFETN